MTKEEFLQLGEYFIRLVRYAIQEDKNAPLPVKADTIAWEHLFALAEKHSLTALCFSVGVFINMLESLLALKVHYGSSCYKLHFACGA